MRAAAALTLRAGGETFASIAVKLGYKSRQAAHSAVTSALLATLQESSEQARALDVERLDALWRLTYAKAKRGSLEAVHACIRIMERRAKLLGLDAPVKINAKVAAVGGVLVVPGPMDEESWQQAAIKSQVALADMERAVWEKPEDAKQ